MRKTLWFVLGIMGVLLYCPAAVEAAGEEAEASVIEEPTVVDLKAPNPALARPAEATSESLGEYGASESAAFVGMPAPETLPVVGTVGAFEDDPVKYTLGKDDIITLEIRRHPEFSGTYVINSEGKIQYKYVGDIYVSGLTKNELKEKLTKILSSYLVAPAVEVTIVEYRSKVFYVIGEVGHPGKFYMMADEIPIREAVVQAGLPLLSASASKAKLITPAEDGKPKTVKINLDKMLYKGDLRQNVMMKPGDVLYVPATLVTKFMRKIAPVAQPVQSVAGAESSFYRLGSDRNRR